MKIEELPSNLPEAARRRWERLSLRFRLEGDRLDLGGTEILFFRVAEPEKLLDELIERGEEDQAYRDEQIPYWAELWPASIVLAEYLLVDKPPRAGDQVLELGCGLGLAGIAAAKAGAERVILSDYLDDALEVAALNWSVNFSSEPLVLNLDWREPFGGPYDFVIAADVAYEKRAFDPLLNAFDILLKPGGRLLLGEPGRSFSKPFLDALRDRGFAGSEARRSIEFKGVRTAVNILDLIWER